MRWSKKKPAKVILLSYWPSWAHHVHGELLVCRESPPLKSSTASDLKCVSCFSSAGSSLGFCRYPYMLLKISRITLLQRLDPIFLVTALHFISYPNSLHDGSKVFNQFNLTSTKKLEVAKKHEEARCSMKRKCQSLLEQAFLRCFTRPLPIVGTKRTWA
jgi:hypothetical protein